MSPVHQTCISCGAKCSLHVSGKCSKCRTITCRCGAVFVQQRQHRACSECRRKLRERDYRAAYRGRDISTLGEGM